MAAQSATGTEESSDWKPTGYPKLARQMANSTNLMVFRRFNDLNIFNLLSLQAELVDLEGQLQGMWEYDDTVNEDKNYSRNFKSLRETMDSINQESNDEPNGKLEPNGNPNEQWKLVVKIREVLKEYNEALLQVVEMSNLSGPDAQSFKTLKSWLVTKAGGNNFLSDYELRTWTPKDAKEDDRTDFIALVDPGGENDFFQRWISSTPLKWFHKHVISPMRRKSPSDGKQDLESNDQETGIVNYKDSTLNKISVFVTLFLALGFLMGAICALYFNKNMLQRFGIMAGFTTAFGIALMFFTTASRIEIFSSTAAFAAVEVVFIGSVST